MSISNGVPRSSSSFSPSALAVAHNLYDRLTNFHTGSDRAEIYELAISYALSPGRTQQNPKFLTHDVLRDARKTFFRRQRREHKLVEEIGAAVGPTQTKGVEQVLASSNMVAGLSLVDNKPLEDRLVTIELEQEIRYGVSALGAKAIRCFDGLLSGEEIQETATALGSSTRTVDRYRKKIRGVASRAMETRDV